MSFFKIFKKKESNSLVSVSEDIHYFNSIAGTWPVKFENSSHKNDVLSHWKVVVGKAQSA